MEQLPLELLDAICARLSSADVVLGLRGTCRCLRHYVDLREYSIPVSVALERGVLTIRADEEKEEEDGVLGIKLFECSSDDSKVDENCPEELSSLGESAIEALSAVAESPFLELKSVQLSKFSIPHGALSAHILPLLPRGCGLRFVGCALQTLFPQSAELTRSLANGHVTMEACLLWPPDCDESAEGGEDAEGEEGEGGATEDPPLHKLTIREPTTVLHYSFWNIHATFQRSLKCLDWDIGIEAECFATGLRHLEELTISDVSDDCIALLSNIKRIVVRPAPLSSCYSDGSELSTLGIRRLVEKLLEHQRADFEGELFVSARRATSNPLLVRRIDQIVDSGPVLPLETHSFAYQGNGIAVRVQASPSNESEGQRRGFVFHIVSSSIA